MNQDNDNNKNLYMNNGKIGYQNTQTEDVEEGEWMSYVHPEVLEYLLEHELRQNPGKTLSQLVEGELTP